MKNRKYRGISINPTKFERGQIKFYLFMIPFAIFMAMPIVYIVFHAFKPMDELLAYPPKFITLRPTFDNFAKLFAATSSSNQPMSIYLFNSIVSTILVVAFTVLISVFAGFVLSKKDFKGKSIIFKANTLSMMFVPIAVAIPRYIIMKNVGLLDTFAAHVLPLLAMPVGLFLIKQFIDQFPDALVEAARIDGANDYCIVLRIIVPIIKPAIATVAILSFQAAWNSIEASTMLIDSENLKSFAFYMSTLTSATAAAGNTLAGQGMAAAASLIMFLPNIILFLILQSKVMNTMAHSGIK